MVKKSAIAETASKKTYVSIGISALSFNALLHLFMVYIVFPLKETSVSLYIPARGGGKTFFVNIQEFLVASYGAIAVSVVILVAVLLMIRAEKLKAAMYTLAIYIFFAIQYAAIYAGNAIDEMWGGAWSAITVAIIFITGIYAIFLLTRNSTKTIDRK